MTTISKFTTATAAATEVDARARRYVAEHQGATYQEAFAAVLQADKALAEAYAQPASRRARMAAPTDARSQPAVPVAADVEREIKDWITRALDAGMAGSLPGALGQLSIEANKLAKGGVPVEEAARRAMDLFPHLVSMSKLLLDDIRRNAPEKTPVPTSETAQSPGDIVHMRAKALTEKHPPMDYSEAMGAVLSEDPDL